MWPKRKKPADSEAPQDSDSDEDSRQCEPEDTETPVTADVIATVRHRAVRLLARREHGRLELREKLLQRDLPGAAIDIALEQLAEKGMQCDVRFAESYTRMRINRGFGPSKIRADLSARKLAKDIVSDSLADCDVDWTENAFSALLKRFGDPENEYGRVTADPEFGSSAADRARMQRFLLSRGYDHSQINAAINRLRQRVE